MLLSVLLKDIKQMLQYDLKFTLKVCCYKKSNYFQGLDLQSVSNLIHECVVYCFQMYST